MRREKKKWKKKKKRIRRKKRKRKEGKEKKGERDGEGEMLGEEREGGGRICCSHQRLKGLKSKEADLDVPCEIMMIVIDNNNS